SLRSLASLRLCVSVLRAAVRAKSQRRQVTQRSFREILSVRSSSVMYPKFSILIFAATLFFGAGRLPAQDGAGVRGTLRFAEEKTTYRIGEPIRLVLE